MTLNEVMKETADAIREKTGKSELIAPVNFAEEIKGITSGGGESGGGSDWHYFDVSEVDLTDPAISLPVAMCYVMVKWTMDDEVGIGTAGVFELLSSFAGPNKTKVLAFGGDYTQRIIFGGQDSSYSVAIEELKAYGISLTEITKEQFYDLNA